MRSRIRSPVFRRLLVGVGAVRLREVLLLQLSGVWQGWERSTAWPWNACGRGLRRVVDCAIRPTNHKVLIYVYIYICIYIYLFIYISRPSVYCRPGHVCNRNELNGGELYHYNNIALWRVQECRRHECSLQSVILILVLCHACSHFTSSYASLTAMQEKSVTSMNSGQIYRCG